MGQAGRLRCSCLGLR